MLECISRLLRRDGSDRIRSISAIPSRSQRKLQAPKKCVESVVGTTGAGPGLRWESTALDSGASPAGLREWHPRRDFVHSKSGKSRNPVGEKTTNESGSDRGVVSDSGQKKASQYSLHGAGIEAYNHEFWWNLGEITTKPKKIAHRLCGDSPILVETLSGQRREVMICQPKKSMKSYSSEIQSSGHTGAYTKSAGAKATKDAREVAVRLFDVLELEGER
ncbi:hypothetical protein C8R45DRAFT_1074112 [Mycena sanguinolenta]|nr:hypothetical protein C8R45DRAFT_1074112 [Mycena sanguinolenta]